MKRVATDICHSDTESTQKFATEAQRHGENLLLFCFSPCLCASVAKLNL